MLVRTRQDFAETVTYIANNTSLFIALYLETMHYCITVYSCDMHLKISILQHSQLLFNLNVCPVI